MLDEVCAYLNNYFEDMQNARVGDFDITGGAIELSNVKDGQYYRIVGSALNDGIYRYPSYDLVDETFFGAVYPMCVPVSLLKLTEEIEAWQSANADKLASPYTSESFAGYTYSKATNADGTAYSWQTAFAARLKPWRCL